MDTRVKPAYDELGAYDDIMQAAPAASAACRAKIPPPSSAPCRRAAGPESGQRRPGKQLPIDHRAMYPPPGATFVASPARESIAESLVAPIRLRSVFRTMR